MRSTIEVHEARERRAAKLASALEAGVPRSVDTVSVLCCARHCEDSMVAARAAELLGASVISFPVDIPPEELRRLLAAADASVLLACEEGTHLWRVSQSPVVVFGDGPGVRWWRMLELRTEAKTSRETLPWQPRLRATRGTYQWSLTSEPGRSGSSPGQAQHGPNLVLSTDQAAEPTAA